jgi:hypothetical protein
MPMDRSLHDRIIMRPSDLLKRLQDSPFRAFRIHLSDGTMLDMTQPGMVIVGESTAILPTLFVKDDDGYQLVKKWRTVAIDHITQFSDIEPEPGGKTGRRG